MKTQRDDASRIPTEDTSAMFGRGDNVYIEPDGGHLTPRHGVVSDMWQDDTGWWYDVLVITANSAEPPVYRLCTASQLDAI